MRDIIAIAKRELRKAFKNKGTIFEVFVGPIFGILSGTIIMFLLLQSTFQQQINFEADGYVVNAPESVAADFEELGVVSADASEIDGIREAVAKGDVDILVVFPSDFEFTTDPEALHNIEMWYNSGESTSATAMQHVVTILDSERPSAFTLNADDSIKYDLMKEEAFFSTIIGASFPMWVVMSVLFATTSFSAYAVAIDKERGFMNMLLISPVKRIHIAWGKITASIALSAISAVAGIIGTVITVIVYNAMNLGGTASFGIGTYATLFLCMLAGSVAMAAFSFFVSVTSKDVREASLKTGLIPTVFSMVAIVYVVPELEEFIANLGIAAYCVPVLNMVFALHDLIVEEASWTNIAVAVAVNVLVAVVFVFVAAKKFDDEKVMQGK